MKALLSKLEKQQRITDKALEELNFVLDEINELYPNTDIMLGEIKLQAYVKTNSGFNFGGYQLERDDLGVMGFIPEDSESLGKGFYYAGDYNAWVQYVDKYDVLYILKHLKKWIEELNKKEENLNEELENILKTFKNKDEY